MHSLAKSAETVTLALFRANPDADDNDTKSRAVSVLHEMGHGVRASRAAVDAVWAARIGISDAN